MKPAWRRGNFLKAPKFENTWTDAIGRKFMILSKEQMEKMPWGLINSADWGENDWLAYVRVGKDEYGSPNELPDEEEMINASRDGASVKFKVITVFTNVGRTKTVPIIVQPM